MNSVSPPILPLRHAPPSTRRYFILDTNILNFAITGPGGDVIKRLNAGLKQANLITPSETAFCMTPFQLMEVLGIKLPVVSISPPELKGARAGDIVGKIVDQAMAAYLATPELSPTILEQRAQERRTYLPPEGLALFDICVLTPCSNPGVAGQIASALAWDHALKFVYPKSIAADVNHFLATLLLSTTLPHVSRFRIAKRLWDIFYAQGRSLVEAARSEIESANKAMRLKTTRDFLDCDLFHLACFGWFDHDVIVITCDPPETILKRIAVYKGMVSAVAANGVDLDSSRLPAIRAGVVVRCEPDGTFSHIFPVQKIPTIV